MGKLRDAHIHIAEHGRALWSPSLADCSSLGECLDRVTDATSGVGPAEWVIVSGARPHSWPEERLPFAWELDEAGGGRPVVVNAFELHTMSCSTAALRAASIGPQSPDPPKGRIVRASGRPTGVLLEDAAWLVREVIPPRNEARYRLDVRYALEDLRAYGYTELHEMLAEPRLVDALIELARQGVRLPRIRLHAPCSHMEEVRSKVDELGDERVEMGGLKLFADGTLHARTALMLDPYVGASGDCSCGQAMLEPEELDSRFAEAGRQGYDVAIHALGDSAVRMCLDAYSRAGGTPERAGFLLRLEHAQFIHPDDVDRFADMGVVASVQPCHLLADLEGVYRYVPDRVDRAFPLKDLVEAAERRGRDPRQLIWLGSDSPVASPDPGDAIQAAVYRRKHDAPVEDALGIEQAISEERAWSLFRAAHPPG